jgi:hypothetical protein
MNLVLKITPRFLGPASVGTVELIKLLRQQLALPLSAAKGFVDRCVFDGETVVIPLPDSVDSAGLLNAIKSLDTPAVIDASIKG